MDDHWVHLNDGEPVSANRAITVQMKRWNEEKESLLASNAKLGIRISGEDGVEAVVQELRHFSLVVLEFPVFTDGRCFSLARLLRDRYDYQGELRAKGDVLRDQLFFLARVGVNAFELKQATPEYLQEALSAFDDFTVKYQAASDEALPLYKRQRRQ